MTAASPGIIALTMRNDHYPTYEDYVFALAEEMRMEYELIVAKGLVLQLDCPDLAMERHISYQDEPLEAFQAVVEPPHRGHQPRLAEHPPGSRCGCTSVGATARARTTTTSP